MKQLRPLIISGKEVLPLVEGGKGVAVTDGKSSGAWAASGGIGTFSGVFADLYDSNGETVPLVFNGRTRKERSIELMVHSIKAAISQAQLAHDIAGGEGRIHMNIMWGISYAEHILKGVLEKARELVHGITCGAGMPFKLAEIVSKYDAYYYPIVSSARAFSLLWRRAYHRFRDWLGGVVYEDPWKAGGHNGLSTNEDPLVPELPYARVLALRNVMREFGLHDVPIIMAGGVWFLRDWADWIDNPELGPIAFQFGTRPLLTVESPIPQTWKNKLLTLKKGDVSLNHCSPTGFYSSAISNQFLHSLRDRSSRQITFYMPTTEEETMKLEKLHIRDSGDRFIYVKKESLEEARLWIKDGYTKIVKTPDNTVIFMKHEEFETVRSDQVNCAGCLAYCKFSGWTDDERFQHEGSQDARSYCIRKTLCNVVHDGDVENELVFAGHSAYMFGIDPFYKRGIPTVAQLLDRIQTGD